MPSALKESLSSYLAFQLKPRALPFHLQITHELEVIEQKFGIGRPMSSHEQDIIYKKFIEVLETENWYTLTLRDWKNAAYILFYNDIKLASNPKFIIKYKDWLFQQKSAGSWKKLIHAYLRDYDFRHDHNSTYTLLSEWITKTLNKQDLPNGLAIWRDRHKKLNLFDKNSNTKATEEFFLEDCKSEWNRFINLSGLSGELSSTGYINTVAKNLLTSLNQKGNDAHQNFRPFFETDNKLRFNKTSVLGSIRLFYANALRIDATPNADGYDIVPVLLRQRPKDSDTEDSNPEHEALLMRAASLHPDYRRQKSYANDQSFIEDSARLKKCFDILEDIKNKREKALIFIEYDLWHQSDFLPALLKRKFNLPELPMIINGGVKGQDRQKRVERFQAERDVFDVMLISPKAGGVGLTLTAANHVIHLTRWWNPAVEDQATDRVYRIGQKREVHVYYPMAVHPELQNTSFDVCLNNLLDKKRRLSQDVLLPILDNERDQQELFKKTVRSKDNDLVNISEMSQFTPKQFEAYVISQLQKSASIYNWTARSTPNSWDGGADVIIETTAGEILAVIQCKHSSNPEATTTGSEDIRRALQTYRLKNGICVLITNAKASLADTRWKNEDPERNIILQGKDALSPESIISKIACNQETIS